MNNSIAYDDGCLCENESDNKLLSENKNKKYITMFVNILKTAEHRFCFCDSVSRYWDQT